MTKEYPVIYEWAGKNFSGYAPDVAGCMATAKTLPDMREVLKGALESHLKWMRDEGDPIPCPSDRVTVDMEPNAEFPQRRGYYVIVEKLNIEVPRPQTSRPRLTGARKSVASKRRVLQAA